MKKLFLLLMLFITLISYAEVQSLYLADGNKFEVYFSDDNGKFDESLETIESKIFADLDKDILTLILRFKNIEKRLWTDKVKVIADNGYMIEAETPFFEEKLTDVEYGEVGTISFNKLGLDILKNISKSEKVEVIFEGEFGVVKKLLTKEEKQRLYNTVINFENDSF